MNNFEKTWQAQKCTGKKIYFITPRFYYLPCFLLWCRDRISNVFPADSIPQSLSDLSQTSCACALTVSLVLM